MADAKQKLLIVEDDLDVADMLNAYFRVQGYDVMTVNWGEDGLRAAQTHEPDLVILDIRLPDIDGFEVANRLRASRKTQEIPIIFLTEKRERADRLRGLELGADDYITKPFDVQELRLRVRNALNRSKQDTLTNPVTGLPEGSLVDERLAQTLRAGEWALVLVSLINLDSFREAYGFVASDDVVRAASLMVHNALREAGGEQEFLGHFGAADFIMTMAPANVAGLEERIRARLEQSLEYFYPLKDRNGLTARADRLGVQVEKFSSQETPLASVTELRALAARRNK